MLYKCTYVLHCSRAYIRCPDTPIRYAMFHQDCPSGTMNSEVRASVCVCVCVRVGLCWHNKCTLMMYTYLIVSQDFCRIHQRHFPSGGTSDLGSLIYSTFEHNESGLVEFDQFIRSLSVTLRGTREEKLECKLKSLWHNHHCHRVLHPLDHFNVYQLIQM